MVPHLQQHFVRLICALGLYIAFLALMAIGPWTMLNMLNIWNLFPRGRLWAKCWHGALWSLVVKIGYAWGEWDLPHSGDPVLWQRPSDAKQVKPKPCCSLRANLSARSVSEQESVEQGQMWQCHKLVVKLQKTLIKHP